MRGWYRLSVQDSTPDVAELLIYDVIGYDFWTGEGVAAKQFVKDLAALPESVATIKVRVNSPGGDVFDAVAIANALKQHRARVEMSIEGLAASAATIITCAGDSIAIADNALMMIHNPWSWVIGSAKDMRKAADDLDTIRGAIIATYGWVSPLNAEELGALMDAETWFDADEAIANGFATDKVVGMKAAALLERRAIAKLTVPAKHQARIAAFLQPEPAPPASPAVAEASEVLKLCREGGCLEQAESLIAAKATTAAVRERIAYAREVTALCTTAKLPELAAGYVQTNAPVAVVKAQLTTLTAKLAGIEINAALRVEGQPVPTADANPLSPTAIYRGRNAPATAAKGA